MFLISWMRKVLVGLESVFKTMKNMSLNVSKS